MAVREGVHRIHHDGLDAATRSVLEDVIDTWHDISQALAGTRAVLSVGLWGLRGLCFGQMLA